MNVAQVYHAEVAATFADWVTSEVGEIPRVTGEEVPDV